MSRGSTSHSPFVLAFGEIRRSAPAAGKSGAYPPYNIERVAADEPGVGRLRIVVAVAGFSAEQLEIRHDADQLIIRGRQKDERERDHIHRGIAARQFQRVFLLGEAMRVAVATLDRGILSVELAPAETK